MGTHHSENKARAYQIVRLKFGVAEPSAALGRIVRGVPIIDKIWGLGYLSDEFRKIATVIAKN